jgi:hypothetical protein
MASARSARAPAGRVIRKKGCGTVGASADASAKSGSCNLPFMPHFALCIGQVQCAVLPCMDAHMGHVVWQQQLALAKIASGVASKARITRIACMRRIGQRDLTKSRKQHLTAHSGLLVRNILG